MSKIYRHPLSIRIWHWVNALIIIILIATGMQLRIPDITIIPHYSFVIGLHKYTGFALAGSFIAWLVCYAFAGGLVGHYMLTFRDIKVIPRQAWYYVYGLFRQRENPFRPSPASKFNPLQKIAYSSVMVIFTPVVIVTGILFSDIFYFLRIIDILGGVRVLDAVHVTFGYFFLIYLVVHIYMATLGEKPYTHIRSMITGYENEPAGHQAADDVPCAEKSAEIVKLQQPGTPDN